NRFKRHGWGLDDLATWRLGDLVTWRLGDLATSTRQLTNSPTHQFHALGPAARTSAVTPCSKVLKFSTNMSASLAACSSHRDPFAEHPRVAARRQRQKRRPKTGAEGGLGLGDALFGPRDLRGVPRQEVIHRGFRREPRNRRQHAKRIGREHHHVLRMAALAR